MNKLLEILTDLHPEIDFSQKVNLIDDGFLDSFDIITLVGELNHNFKISIGIDDLTPENFNSMESIEKLIERIKPN
jgi:acyl carrier protein